MDRSNNDRGFCSFRDASTVHSRANAATKRRLGRVLLLLFEDRRLNGRIDAVRASCIIARAFVERWDDQLSVSYRCRARASTDAAQFSTGGSGCRLAASVTRTTQLSLPLSYRNQSAVVAALSALSRICIGGSEACQTIWYFPRIIRRWVQGGGSTVFASCDPHTISNSSSTASSAKHLAALWLTVCTRCAEAARTRNSPVCIWLPFVSLWCPTCGNKEDGSPSHLSHLPQAVCTAGRPAETPVFARAMLPGLPRTREPVVACRAAMCRLRALLRAPSGVASRLGHSGSSTATAIYDGTTWVAKTWSGAARGGDPDGNGD